MRSFKYSYRPFTRLRWLSCIVLLIGTFITFLLAEPPEQRIWVGVPWLGAMLFHFVVVIVDLFRQQRNAATTPHGS